MTGSRPIDNLNAYLVALNAELAVGVRSRSRILEEAGEHLYQAALAEHAQLAAQVERGERPAIGDALWTEAQARAITDFGSPEKVASEFQEGPLGALDKRMGLVDASFEAWLRSRPILAGTIWAAATSLGWIALGLAIFALGSLSDIGYAMNVLMPFVMLAVVFFCARMVFVVRRRAYCRGLPLVQLPGLRLVALRDWVGYFFFTGYVALTDPASSNQLIAFWIALALVVEAAARLARRFGRAGGWSAYGEDPDENWSKYMTGLWTSAAITLLLIALRSSSLGLAAALGLLLVAVTATTAFVRRLAWNSSVKRNWGRTYEMRAAAG